MGWENKHKNGSHRNLALWDGLASETSPSQLHYKCVACEAPTTYFLFFLGKKNIKLIVKKSCVLVLALINGMLVFHFGVNRF